jgi:hypothetical protein
MYRFSNIAIQTFDGVVLSADLTLLAALGPPACTSRLSPQSPLAIHLAKCPPRSDFFATCRRRVMTEASAIAGSSLQRGLDARVHKVVAFPKQRLA